MWKTKADVYRCTKGDTNKNTFYALLTQTRVLDTDDNERNPPTKIKGDILIIFHTTLHYIHITAECFECEEMVTYSDIFVHKI